MLPSISSRLARLGRRFVGSEHGNVAITLGVAIVPIFFVVGTAIDYGRAANARSAMQAAADAAALMVAKEAPTLTQAQLNTKAAAYFNALLNRTDVDALTVSASYALDGSSGQTVTLNANGNIANNFMSMAMLGNTKTTNLGTSSTVKWANSRYRVALALDNTGSMAQSGKLDQLKVAAKQMVEDFYAMAKNDADVYMSIVPFAQTVRINPNLKLSTWLRWSGPNKDGWEDLHGSCIGNSNKKTRATCEANGKVWLAQSGPLNWNGCVMDRDKNYDATNDTPTVLNSGTMVWPQDDPYCPTNEILGMTSVRAAKSTLTSKIDAMTALGATNQTIGVAWAWLTHTINAGPYPAPAKDSTYDYKDVIILLTDGANTENRWDGNGSDWSSAVDARQSLLCSNIQAAKVTVFVIQVSTASEPVSAVTKACATYPDDPTYYSNVSQASQISVKFKSIFDALSRLRVSQ